MYHIVSPVEVFQLIQENYKNHLDSGTMVYRAAIDRGVYRKKAMKPIIEAIQQYRLYKKRYLDSIVAAPFTKKKWESLDFIAISVEFLSDQMQEKSVAAKHPWITDSVVGFFTGALVLAALLAVAAIPMIGLIGLTGLSVVIAAAVSHILFDKVSVLHYKFNKKNRLDIHAVIEVIQTEEENLKSLVAYFDKKHHTALKELEAFHQEAHPFSFAKWFDVHSNSPLLLGSSRAWALEFSRRCNHSVTSHAASWPWIKKMIENTNAQTQALQSMLSDHLGLRTNSKQSLNTLLQVLKNTQVYLRASTSNKHYARFMSAFRVYSAMRQQILEIVGYSPIDQYPGALPEELITFYTAPFAQGGLGGLASDLERIRSIAPQPDQASDQASDEALSLFTRLIHTAYNVSGQLHRARNSFILLGDRQYRSFLGLPTKVDVPLETVITLHNIDNYLQASFDFLCSLNNYKDMPDSQNREVKSSINTDTYHLYRMLFMRQLADFWCPTNYHYDNAIKQRIETFVKEKFACDPEIMLSAIYHQSLLVEPKRRNNPTIMHHIDNRLTIIRLSAVASALRTDMAYHVSPPCFVQDETAAFQDNQMGYNIDFSGLFDHLREPASIAPLTLDSEKMVTPAEEIVASAVSAEEHTDVMADFHEVPTQEMLPLIHPGDRDASIRSQTGTPQPVIVQDEDSVVPQQDMTISLQQQTPDVNQSAVVILRSSSPVSSAVGVDRSDEPIVRDSGVSLEDKKTKLHRTSRISSIFRVTSKPISYLDCRNELETYAQKTQEKRNIFGKNAANKITSERKRLFARTVMELFDNIFQEKPLESEPVFEEDILQYAQSDKSNHLGPLLKKCMISLGGSADQRLEDFLNSKVVRPEEAVLTSL